MDDFDINYFVNSEPIILDNDSAEGLRQAQYDSYVEIARHFLMEKSKEHAIVVLPTGAGKTGVMATAPFGISQGRVLIITPQLVIKDHVVDSLDSSSANNFWLKYGIFQEFDELPQVLEYDNDTRDEELEESNIVILNIHKLSTKYRNSLLRKVKSDFFDMIIIDEAHHSPAETWQKSIEHFSEAKILKLTGTPFRADRKPIEGKVIINYRLGKAMQEGIVKTLKQFTIIPEELYLTIDGDTTMKYTIDELIEKGIKDSNYTTRSVALSPECNKQIIEASIDELNEKINVQSPLPHKIIAVCCSIEHAEQVKALYEEKKLSVALVHSDLNKNERSESLRRIESHQVQVVIHVAMLGEGYDHPYLSVAAIFRPFRSLAPYSQFIGRILRKIPTHESSHAYDNIGSVIAHQELNLEPLWKEYQEELDFSEMINSVKKSEKQEKDLEKKLRDVKDIDKSTGAVEVLGEPAKEEEYYEFTQAAKEYEEYEQEIKDTVEELRKALPKKTDKELRRLAKENSGKQMFNPLLKNPKKYRRQLRERFDARIKYELPAELLSKFQLRKEGRELIELPINPRHSWVLNNDPDNAAIISKYLTSLYNVKYGNRSNWRIPDFEHALNEMDDSVNHLNIMIKSVVKRRK